MQTKKPHPGIFIYAILSEVNGINTKNMK